VNVDRHHSASVELTSSSSSSMVRGLSQKSAGFAMTKIGRKKSLAVALPVSSRVAGRGLQ